MKEQDLDLIKAPLNAQQSHWEKMFTENIEMFGIEPSYPARRAAEIFKKAGAKLILELGGGQGRDTLFFARNGLQVYVLDYSQEGVETIREKADRLGLSVSVLTFQHDVRQSLPFDDDFFGRVLFPHALLHGTHHTRT